MIRIIPTASTNVKRWGIFYPFKKTIRGFPSNIFSPRHKRRNPSKIRVRVVRWSDGQFFLRRVSNLTQNFNYIYNVIIYIIKDIF